MIVYTEKSDGLKDYLNKIWINRSLIQTFAKRDLKIKYAQTTLGVSWTIFQPTALVIIFTLFFSVLLKFETRYPYILYVLSGVLIWGLFSYIFAQASSSLQQNQDLIRKMNFPKILLLVSKVIPALIEFSIILVLLLILMVIFHLDFRWSMFLFPFLILPVILFSLGISLILCAVSLKNRDLFHLVPFLVNFGIWLTPVFYPLSIIPEEYKNLVYLNPMAASIQLFRWSFFGDSLNGFVLLGVGICFIIFFIGFRVFMNVEDKIIDTL